MYDRFKIQPPLLYVPFRQRSLCLPVCTVCSRLFLPFDARLTDMTIIGVILTDAVFGFRFGFRFDLRHGSNDSL